MVRLKLIADLVINHSSDEHPWFEKSINRIHPYTDFYVWADPKGFDDEGKPIPPNNWAVLGNGTTKEANSIFTSSPSNSQTSIYVVSN
ncbi:Alpha-amylase domain [Sarracenia purpurea var. burkii]